MVGFDGGGMEVIWVESMATVAGGILFWVGTVGEWMGSRDEVGARRSLGLPEMGLARVRVGQTWRCRRGEGSRRVVVRDGGREFRCE